MSLCACLTLCLSNSRAVYPSASRRFCLFVSLFPPLHSLGAGVEQLLLGISDEAQLAAAGERARQDSSLSEDRPAKRATGYGQVLAAPAVPL